MTGLGIARDQRRREHMEDRIVTGLAGGAVVIGVFDGHGGAIVAEHAAQALVALVDDASRQGLPDDRLWQRVFEGLDLRSSFCGSTATVMLVRDAELSVAWVGDSRAVVVTRDAWHVVTPDHRIDNAAERRRVVAAGARIVPPYAVDPRTDHGLMVTRALGDTSLRGIGITAEPETRTMLLGENDIGFVAATDGLWDVVRSAEAAALCRAEAPERAASRLVELVCARRGTDNVSVVVGRFAELTPPGRAR